MSETIRDWSKKSWHLSLSLLFFSRPFYEHPIIITMPEPLIFRAGVSMQAEELSRIISPLEKESEEKSDGWKWKQNAHIWMLKSNYMRERKFSCSSSRIDIYRTLVFFIIEQIIITHWVFLIEKDARSPFHLHEAKRNDKRDDFLRRGEWDFLLTFITSESFTGH